MPIAEALVIGFITGLMAGTFGVGGGIVATPLMCVWMGLGAHEAIGTTLSIIAPTSLAGAYNYYKQNLVDFAVVRGTALPALVMSIVGAWVTERVHGKAMMIYFAGLVILASLDMLLALSQRVKERFSKSRDESEYRSPGFLAVLPFGLLAGFLSGFFGVGGGFIMVPLFISVLKMPVKMALGTSLVCIAAISVPGTVTHFLLHHVRLDLAFWLVVTAIPGSMLGSRMALRLKDSSLKRAFGVILLVVAISLIIRELGVK